MNSSERSHELRATPRWKHGAIPVVGLTGGIGGGKSEVAAILAERGAAVIDADSVGHEGFAGGPSGFQQPDRRPVREDASQGSAEGLRA